MEKIHGPLRRVAAGQALFTQGEPAAATYTVVNGWVGLGDVLRDGRAVMLHIVMPGDIISLEYQGARSARGAVALTDVTLCSLSQSAHDALRREDDLYDRRYQAAVASELHFAYEHAADIALTTALERVAKLLLELAIRSRRRRPLAGDRIPAPLSQVQIGLLTGLTAVHVSRTLRKLREDGLVDFDRHVIEVLNPAALERVAGVSEDTVAMWT
jgi:CRP/FNR family transcriptional regulator